MPINPGKLDRRVAIQTGTESRDASGGVSISWATTTTVWGSRLDQGGREFRAVGAQFAEANAAFRIRFYSGLTPKHRLQCESVTYDVLGIIEEGRREFQLIAAKSVTVTPAP